MITVTYVTTSVLTRWPSLCDHVHAYFIIAVQLKWCIIIVIHCLTLQEQSVWMVALLQATVRIISRPHPRRVRSLVWLLSDISGGGRLRSLDCVRFSLPQLSAWWSQRLPASARISTGILCNRSKPSFFKIWNNSQIIFFLNGELP